MQQTEQMCLVVQNLEFKVKVRYQTFQGQGKTSSITTVKICTEVMSLRSRQDTTSSFYMYRTWILGQGKTSKH